MMEAAPLRYVPFPDHVLPEPVGTFVREASAAIGCDASYIALPTLACLARAIGNTRVIKLKRTWTEPAIIWAAIVGKSGTHKSPAIQAATKILAQKQSEAIAEYAEANARYAQEQAQYDKDYAAWKREKKTTEPPPWEPKQPHCQRFIASDVTIEALAVLLHGQDDGVLVVRDELAGWVNGIGQYKAGGKGADAGHWLSCWSGTPMTFDRKTGNTPMIHVPRASVSIVGGVQPAILQRAMGVEHLQDGMCARLLMAMPKPKRVTWSEAIVNPEIEALMANVFDELLKLEPAATPEGEPEPFAVPLTPEAKSAWVEYYNRHRAEMESLDADLTSAYAKLEAYAARFGLIFQMVAAAAGAASNDVIDQTAIEAGIALSDWFANEAKRVYGMFAETDDERDRRELIEWIAKQGGVVTARDLARGPRKFRKDAEPVLNDLMLRGVGHWMFRPPGPKGGRATRVFCLASRSGPPPGIYRTEWEANEGQALPPGESALRMIHERMDGDETSGDETHLKPEQNGGCVTRGSVTKGRNAGEDRA